MLKRVITTLLILTLSPTAYAQDIINNVGNTINTKEYPHAEEVLPKKVDDKIVIEGSVEKNIDLTLERCLEIALGNNPQINAAFHDVLASDSRIKQVWSNYFPQFSWQTGYTKIKQLQLSDALGRNLTFNYFILGQITLQQMLYDFGVTQNQATIRRLEYEGQKSTLSETINTVIYQTKDAYYNLLYSYENERVAKIRSRNTQCFMTRLKPSTK